MKKQNQLEQAECLKIGNWLFLTQSHELKGHNRTVRLEPRVASLLHYLAVRAGDTISRETLLEALWPGLVVSDEALTNAINKLRKAFADDRFNPHIIETIPKSGYRLIAKVANCQAESNDVLQKNYISNDSLLLPITDNDQSFRQLFFGSLRLRIISISGLLIFFLIVMTMSYYLVRQNTDALTGVDDTYSSASKQISIAVLPLTSLSNGPDQDYFSDGITEDLITDLSRISGLNVIARNSVFVYKGLTPEPQEVAQQLGARYILEGSIRKDTNQVRINVKLIDTSTGFNLWAERFDKNITDVFDLQDHLAREIAAALAIQLTEKEELLITKSTTLSVEALKHYFLGRAYYGSTSKQENVQSRKFYRRAIELDPDYAQAYAELALTYLDDQRRGWSTDDEASLNQAIKLAEQAIRINDTIPQAHFALGFIYLYARQRHDKAITEARKAIQLDPSYADSYALLSSAYFYSGQPEKSLALDRKAMQLNPAASFLYYMHLGRSHFVQGRYKQAIESLNEALARNSNHLPAHLWLAASYGQAGEIDDAEWEIEQVFLLNAEFSTEKWLDFTLHNNPGYRDRLIEGLKKAGLNPGQN